MAAMVTSRNRLGGDGWALESRLLFPPGQPGTGLPWDQ